MANQRDEFGKIYDQYIDKIYRFVFVKVNSDDIAKDICSDTFLKAWEAYKTQKIDNIQAFIYRIARNLVTDYYRQKGRTQVVSAESSPIIVDPGPTLKDQVELASDVQQVRAVLASLKEEYQDAIMLRYIDDLPISEVAKMLGKTEDNTRVTLHRALKALKGKIDEA